ncbi:hypothetical protein COLO4_05923 [Corchorus olitorius]|uniref:Ricin B lectin domain-containing protein n=1 Tax=Corchorus olitorius TaxID=93759 RepID=A0A1R3KPK9_9ROSI|nr:hypothetical protein COLO4_05923 [Corchorus olitorius]
MPRFPIVVELRGLIQRQPEEEEQSLGIVIDPELGKNFLSQLTNKPTYKVYCKADPRFHLTIRDDKVILAPTDPPNQFQHWYKDDKFSTIVTGQALKHSLEETKPVQLIAYNPNDVDESILWSQGEDMGGGYKRIRMVNNIHLNLDANHGCFGVHDGTMIVVSGRNTRANQKWKIEPYCKFLKN